MTTDNYGYAATPKAITLATLTTSTAQEVFDWVVYNLRKQGKKSRTADGMYPCAYRGDSGLKCAAGWCVGDDEYSNQKFEFSSWDFLVEDGKVPPAHDRLIYDLQQTHDSCPLSKWEKCWAELAKKQLLVYTPKALV